MNLINDRYFEDYVVGLVQKFWAIPVTEEEIVDFARRFDPQVIHLDPEGAKKKRFGGIIASGWHTSSLAMRLFVDNYISKVANPVSPGVDELRWIRPVRPGDELSIQVTVLDARQSRSKPECGILTFFIEVANQRGEVVMTMKSISIMLRRGLR